MGKGKLILFDVSLLKEKCFSIKNIGWLIKLRCNSVSINEKLLKFSSMCFIVVVQSWKSVKLKLTNGIINLYKSIRSTIKLIKSKYSVIRILYPSSKRLLRSWSRWNSDSSVE